MVLSVFISADIEDANSVIFRGEDIITKKSPSENPRGEAIQLKTALYVVSMEKLMCLMAVGLAKELSVDLLNDGVLV